MENEKGSREGRHLQCLVRHLDLFSGIGGFALAARMVGGIETVAFCEREPYAQAVLRKHWPDVPICDDIHNMKGTEYGRIDLITGGYPCQPFSLAGKRQGESDDRHLWPEMRRIIEKARPRWILAENVIGHVSMGLDEVLSDLDSIGYSNGATVLPACAVGAPHRRDRVWIVANSKCDSIQRGKIGSQARFIESREEQLAGFLQPCSWPTLSSARACGTGHGISQGVDRNRAIGNAIVPQVAAEILRFMMRVEREANDQIQARPGTGEPTGKGEI